ncbi:LRRC38 [Acrasis kona]|uniref:LRRC38 n=1 Tax=Acrasis kona TaxID=1008807 RepID=A0AAW2Z5U8_9EUKA
MPRHLFAAIVGIFLIGELCGDVPIVIKDIYRANVTVSSNVTFKFDMDVVEQLSTSIHFRVLDELQSPTEWYCVFWPCYIYPTITSRSIEFTVEVPEQTGNLTITNHTINFQTVKLDETFTALKTEHYIIDVPKNTTFSYDSYQELFIAFGDSYQSISSFFGVLKNTHGGVCYLQSALNTKVSLRSQPFKLVIPNKLNELLIVDEKIPNHFFVDVPKNTIVYFTVGFKTQLLCDYESSKKIEFFNTDRIHMPVASIPKTWSCYATSEKHYRHLYNGTIYNMEELPGRGLLLKTDMNEGSVAYSIPPSESPFYILLTINRIGVVTKYSLIEEEGDEVVKFTKTKDEKYHSGILKPNVTYYFYVNGGISFHLEASDNEFKVGLSETDITIIIGVSVGSAVLIASFVLIIVAICLRRRKSTYKQVL